MKKRNRYVLLIIAVLSIFFAIIAVTNFKTSTIKNDFVLYDTSNVTKIFIADKRNNSVTLMKKGQEWYLPDNQLVLKENVDLILKTMLLIEIKYPVSKSAYQNMVRRLAGENTKVEIYQYAPLIDFLGIKLFYKERLTKVFYVGGPTMDNQGTIMKMDKSEELYVTSIPGFNGYLSERFSPKIADWKSHEVFNLKISQIAALKVEFPETPDESYLIENNDNKSFSLTQLKGGIAVSNFDTIRVLELLVSFNKVCYEAYLDDMPSTRLDSIQKSMPFKVVTLTTKMGEKKVLKLYHRYNLSEMLDLNGVPFKYDMDRMYGLFSDIKTPLSFQFFVVDNFTRTLSFLKGGDLPMTQFNTVPNKK